MPPTHSYGFWSVSSTQCVYFNIAVVPLTFLAYPINLNAADIVLTAPINLNPSQSVLVAQMTSQSCNSISTQHIDTAAAAANFTCRAFLISLMFCHLIHSAHQSTLLIHSLPVIMHHHVTLLIFASMLPSSCVTCPFHSTLVSPPGLTQTMGSPDSALGLSGALSSLPGQYCSSPRPHPPTSLGAFDTSNWLTSGKWGGADMTR
jgi:hypothetical protein